MTIILLTVYLVSYFLHLSARVPSLGSMRIDLILGVATLIAVFIAPFEDKFRLKEDTPQRLNRFLLYIFISLPFVTWPGSVINNNLTEWIKVALFFLLIVGAVRNEGQLRWIVTIFLACQIIRIMEPLYLHITTGYWGDMAYSHSGGEMSGLLRLSGAPSDVINANQYAWVIVSTIPFLFYFLWQLDWGGKLFFAVLMVPFSKALLLTGSRSGLLSLGAVIIGIILSGNNKKRNLFFGVFVVLPLLVMLLGKLSPDMQVRYLSLVDSSVAGGDTKQGRINALIKQLGTISHNPLFGNGLGTTREANWNIMGGSAQITHNLYIEILQSTGIIGFSLFMMYIFSMIKCLSKTKLMLIEKGIAENDWLARLASAIQVWVFMDMFYSLSCFGLISWEWYFFGGISAVCYIVAKERPNIRSLTDDRMILEV